MVGRWGLQRGPARQEPRVRGQGMGLSGPLNLHLFFFGGGVGTRPRYSVVCLWRCLLASRHCTFRPSVGPNVFWLCQRSPRMTGEGAQVPFAKDAMCATPLSGQTGTMARHNAQNGQNCCDIHSPFKSTVRKACNAPCPMIIIRIACRRRRRFCGPYVLRWWRVLGRSSGSDAGPSFK